MPFRREEILRYEEIITIVRAATSLGITKVRITGGEPLVRADIVDFVRMLAGVPGIDDISLTTNGVLLTGNAARLRDAGLHRVNISLDTLREERFTRVTRRGSLSSVLAGIDAAQAAGLAPVKINVVVMRGVNDDEVVDFARRTLDLPWHVRFIEFMPIGECQAALKTELGLGDDFLSVGEVQRLIEGLGKLEPEHTVPGNGPARYYRLRGAAGTIGFISPISEHFCFHCNRLRLTADGRLRPCLLSDREVDLRGPLRLGASEEDLRVLISEAIRAKPERHGLAENVVPHLRLMGQIGG